MQRFFRYFRTFFILSILLWGLDRLFPLDTKRLYKPKSTIILDVRGDVLAVKLSRDDYLRVPIEEKEISKDIEEIVLGYEDQYFYSHFGINPLSLLRASFFNLTSTKSIGASTISMQISRMMNHYPRTFFSKFIEMIRAIQLEIHYSKKELLKLYLDNAPYGGNIEGFASASLAYFGQKPHELSIAQIAYLCSIPKNPNRNRPKPNKDINPLKNALLTRLYHEKQIDKIRYERSINERLEVQKKSFKNAIFHLSHRIKEEGFVHTSIDSKLQHQLSEFLSAQSYFLKSYNLHNASAIIIDNKTMKIKAYVGSPNPYDTSHGGQNDGVNFLLSAGSTLKPFIYAKALEEGIITPQQKIYDVPLSLDGYHPLNYDENYLGEVSASEALQHSLNVPAVELDRLLADKGLYEVLKTAQIDSLNKSKYYYGSSLVLGGFGIKLIDLAQLYASLANSGYYQKASWLKDSSTTKKTKLFTPQSSYLISTILSDSARNSLSTSWSYTQGMSKIALKTGTSAHTKDILCMGYTPQYTVGVWFGNFDGSPSQPYNNKSITGLEGAMEVVIKMFGVLQAKEWFKKPKDILTQKICADSINIGSCKSVRYDEIIKGVKRKSPCKILRAEVLNYLFTTHQIDSFEALSQHNCYSEWKKYNPLITAPISNQTYTYNKFLDKNLKKTKFECFSYDTNRTIYWRIDDNLTITSTSAEPLYLYLPPATHTVRCMDTNFKEKTIYFKTDER
jgi:penicillin-binding protein 1C